MRDRVTRYSSTRTRCGGLRRIAEVADIDLRRDEWLSLEIAVKLVRLRSNLA